MNTLEFSTAKRLLCALAAGVALSGCATYGPGYSGYAPVAAGYPAAPYGAYAVGDPYGYDGYYGYGGPAYVGPALGLDLGFYDRGYRGGRRYHGYVNRSHAWSGRPGGHHFEGGSHWGGEHGGEHGRSGGGHGHR